MKCKYCKAKDLPEHARFCPWCGKQQTQDAAEIRVPAPKQLPSGTFFGRLTVNGGRTSVSAPTEAEYYAKARAVKAGLLEAKKAAPKITLGAAIDKYIKSKSNILSPSTLKAYKSYRKYRFEKYLDKDISSINWQRMVNEEARIVKPKTLANAWRLVTASVAACGASTASVTLPASRHGERPWLDYDQIQAFLRSIYSQDCELAALLALHGLRRSELLAITADQVTADTITVSGAMVFDPDGKLIRKDTNKTRTSQRVVHIVIPRLQELVAGREGLLVTTHPNTLRSQINSVCRKNGLPEVGFHGLRHSFASLAYHLDWSEATTMREGGWSSIQTVHNIYTHLAAQDANDDVKRMQDFYKNSNEKSNESQTVDTSAV